MRLVSDVLDNRFTTPLRTLTVISDETRETRGVKTPLVRIKVEGYLHEDDASIVITRAHHMQPPIVMDIAEARAMIGLLAEIDKAWELAPGHPLLELCMANKQTLCCEPEQRS